MPMSLPPDGICIRNRQRVWLLQGVRLLLNSLCCKFLMLIVETLRVSYNPSLLTLFYVSWLAVHATLANGPSFSSFGH